MTAASAAVLRIGGDIARELAIIDGVTARLTASQLAALRTQPGIQVQQDRDLQTMGGPQLDTYQRVAIGADRLGAQGFTGSGVTVAVLDTGLWYSWGPVKNNLSGKNRILAMYNASKNKVQNTADKNGHGTHVASIIADRLSPKRANRRALHRMSVSSACKPSTTMARAVTRP
ncbi:MAG TPA: S8 family serine peptidase [Steroidobacteraceae bacterium]|nr:S8 family serine peptidase [Steroidobacteraceae bacterium]